MPGDKINFLTNGRGNPSPTMLGFDGARATNGRPYDRWKRLPRKAPSGRELARERLREHARLWRF